MWIMTISLDFPTRPFVSKILGNLEVYLQLEVNVLFLSTGKQSCIDIAYFHAVSSAKTTLVAFDPISKRHPLLERLISTRNLIQPI